MLVQRAEAPTRAAFSFGDPTSRQRRSQLRFKGLQVFPQGFNGSTSIFRQANLVFNRQDRFPQRFGFIHGSRPANLSNIAVLSSCSTSTAGDPSPKTSPTSVTPVSFTVIISSRGTIGGGNLNGFQFQPSILSQFFVARYRCTPSSPFFLAAASTLTST